MIPIANSNRATNEAIVRYGPPTRKAIWFTTPDKAGDLMRAIAAGTAPEPIGFVIAANPDAPRSTWHWDGEIDGERIPVYGHDARTAGWEVVRAAAIKARLMAERAAWAMSKRRDLADLLFSIATILENSEIDTPSMVRGYRQAARLLMDSRPVTASDIEACRLGPRVTRRLTTLLPALNESAA
jgi:hypothetical protein